MSCATNAACNYPSGICQSGVCMCDGSHEGSACQFSTQTFFKFMLRVGLPALCIIAAVCGAFLGGASRYFYKQFQTWNKLRKRKAALFGNGWFDSDRYIGPNHHTVVVKKKESKKKKKKQKKRERGRDTSRSPSRSRSRSRGRN